MDQAQRDRLDRQIEHARLIGDRAAELILTGRRDGYDALEALAARLERVAS